MKCKWKSQMPNLRKCIKSFTLKTLKCTSPRLHGAEDVSFILHTVWCGGIKHKAPVALDGYCKMISRPIYFLVITKRFGYVGVLGSWWFSGLGTFFLSIELCFPEIMVMLMIMTWQRGLDNKNSPNVFKQNADLLLFHRTLQEAFVYHPLIKGAGVSVIIEMLLKYTSIKYSNYTYKILKYKKNLLKCGMQHAL